jgi:hypothetical protein
VQSVAEQRDTLTLLQAISRREGVPLPVMVADPDPLDLVLTPERIAAIGGPDIGTMAR